MAFRTDDMQAADFLHARPKLDIRTTTGHVRRDRHGTQLTCPRHDFSFTFVMLRVQHVMDDALPLKHAAQQFGHFNGNRTNQHRLALLVTFRDFLHNRFVFFALRFVNAVVEVFTQAWAVRRNDDDVQIVNALEFVRFRFRRTRHTGQFFVHTEVVLNRDGSQRLRFAFDLHIFLGFKSLVQTFGETAARLRTAREFIDDDDFVVLHDVMDVDFEQAVSAQQL